jgi:hypothetical protein
MAILSIFSGSQLKFAHLALDGLVSLRQDPTQRRLAAIRMNANLREPLPSQANQRYLLSFSA